MTLPPASIDLLCTFFNAAATLEPTLASLSSQTLADARFILVDDGSTDDSAAIARAFCDKDGRFALFTNADRGRGKALNFALSQGSAPLVAILDADDLAHPTWLETACAVMDDRPDVAAISFERLMIGPGETADWPRIQPQATALTDDATTRFAALVHDLGKALTPSSEWPRHGGHEEHGVEVINQLCDRCRAPNRFRELAIIVARHHLDCHRIAELRPDTILRKLEAADGFRRPERFEQFLLACEADARGRSGFEKRDYPQAELWRIALEAAREADFSDLDLPRLGGEAAAAAIRKRRVEEIKDALA